MAGRKHLSSLPKENKERKLLWSERHFFWLTVYVVCLWWSSVLTRFYILTGMTRIIDVGHGECSGGPVPFPDFWNNWSTPTPGKTQSQFLITRRHSFLPQHFLPMHQIASRFFNAWPLLKSTEKKQGWFEMQIPAATNTDLTLVHDNYAMIRSSRRSDAWPSVVLRLTRRTIHHHRQSYAISRKRKTNQHKCTTRLNAWYRACAKPAY